MDRRTRPPLTAALLIVWLTCSLASCVSPTPLPPATGIPSATVVAMKPTVAGGQQPSPTQGMPPSATLTVVSTPAPTVSDPNQRLAESAAFFQAETDEELQVVLADLGEEDAGYIDGPLALAILKRAGWLPVEVKTHKFWLADPQVDDGPMREIFPREKYDWQLRLGALREVDLIQAGLFPGDLLYLIPTNPQRVGKYLLITRKDRDGRIFTTTNLQDSKSGAYRIEEMELFDPAQAEAGWLAGQSGRYKGVMLVRKRSYAGQEPGQEVLNQVLNRGGHWNVLVKQVGGEVSFNREADALIHPASVIKLPLAMLVMKYLASRSGGLAQALAAAPPKAGRTYEQLLHAMLVLSEETATDILERDTVDNLSEVTIRATLDQWGARHTSLEPRRSTAGEIAHLWEELYDRKLLGDEASGRLLDFLGEVTEGDAVRLWKLVPQLPAGSVLYNKRGSLTQPVIVADSGILVLPDGRAYILCLFGTTDEWTHFEDLDVTIADFGIAWYENYIQ